MTLLGYTTGVFDMLHIGHLRILERSKSHCDELVVGVTTDELCSQVKKVQPVIPFDERIEIVRALRFVDRVVPQESMDKLAAWRQIGFHRVFVGSDWQGTEKWNQLEREFEVLGVKVVYFPYTEHTSSTILRSTLRKLYDDADDVVTND
jgi:glycerol-3-phosphate cytidylyltransferase